MNSFNNLIVSAVKVLPKSVIHIFAKKYIAGAKLEDGIRVVGELNSLGCCATMDVLGESISSREEARMSKNQCLEVLDAIEENKLDSNLSIKPTQLGLKIDKKFCFDQVKEILDRAAKYDNFIRFDMEDSSVTEDIIRLFEDARNHYPKVGIVLQSYLKRTVDDVKKLNPSGTNYRICKGIYIEPEKIAFKDREIVREKFLVSLKLMFENGNYVGIATHDDYLVDSAYKMIREMNIERDKYEFQMLYGVKESLRDKINADGHKIRIYVPFGEHWYAYSIRRLQENPQLAWYITKSIFSLN